MNTVCLEEKPHYEALSYVWGTPEERQILDVLEIDDQAFPITRSLFQALHALRSSVDDRLLWADAICIDLHNLEEKIHQINMMSDIYSGAANVVVYLGQPTELTEEGMSNLQSIMDMQESGHDPFWSTVPLPKLEESIGDIISRQWFRRMWTVQEAALARNITLQCGYYKLSWHVDLRTVRAIIFRIKTTAISPYYTLSSGHTSTLDWTPLLDILETQLRQASRREGTVVHRTTLDLAFDFRDRITTVPQDRYLAILAIIENDGGARLKFRPDYTLTLEEVYRQFVAEVQDINGIEDVKLNNELFSDLLVDGKSRRNEL